MSAANEHIVFRVFYCLVHVSETIVEPCMRNNNWIVVLIRHMGDSQAIAVHSHAKQPKIAHRACNARTRHSFFGAAAEQNENMKES